MDIAVELRVHGAAWETIAQVLGRHKRVLSRWLRHYVADWELLFRAAERRAVNEFGRRT